MEIEACFQNLGILFYKEVKKLLLAVSESFIPTTRYGNFS